MYEYPNASYIIFSISFYNLHYAQILCSSKPW